MVKSFLNRLRGDIPKPWIGATIGVAVFGVLGWLVPVIDTGSGLVMPGARDSWRLPSDRHLMPPEGTLDEMLAHPLWGGEPVVTVDAEPEVEEDQGEPWLLVGIVEQGADKIALIRPEGSGKLQERRQGDKMPDGSELTAIEATSVMIMRDDGEQRIFRMFASDGAKEN